MTVDPLTALSQVTSSNKQTSLDQITSQLTASQNNAVPATPFSAVLTDSLNAVDTLQGTAAQAITGLMEGKGVDVHQAMIATAKADSAFELTLAVRNKSVSAYQQLMNTQF